MVTKKTLYESLEEGTGSVVDLITEVVNIWSTCLLERASKDARKGEDELMLIASSFVTCKSGAVLVRVLGSEMLLLAKGIWRFLPFW